VPSRSQYPLRDTPADVCLHQIAGPTFTAEAVSVVRRHGAIDPAIEPPLAGAFVLNFGCQADNFNHGLDWHGA
jgi:hypothetical protein